MHHVVPASLGGTRTVPLCADCHRKVHAPGQALALGQLARISKKRAQIVWLCDECGSRVAGGDGYVALSFAELRACQAARAKFDRQLQARRGRDDAGFVVYSTEDLKSYPDDAHWQVLHAACDPYREASAYWFSIDRVLTIDALLARSIHLTSKDWINDTDWAELITRVAMGTA